MNKIGLALRELYRAEEELADEYVKVGERLAAEHDIWYECKRFAEECHLHADAIRPVAARYEEQLAPADDSEVGETTTAALRHKLSELLGRRPESGLLLLRSLRQLYLQAQEVSFHWLIAGQLAQATRDQELLTLVDELHRETLTQIKWLKTQAKVASPQALVVGSRS
ncbi:MAG: hypothetical protein E6G19_12155 [Actinobacteria bacterium]|nr:MAG: hypothetical protein E6G19_12155 [Actinomycetota bacterium]